MSTRQFSELVKAMTAERQQRLASRVRQSLASVPLEETRKACPVAPAQLADASGVNQGEVSKIEHGRSFRCGKTAS